MKDTAALRQKILIALALPFTIACSGGQAQEDPLPPPPPDATGWTAPARPSAEEAILKAQRAAEIDPSDHWCFSPSDALRLTTKARGQNANGECVAQLDLEKLRHERDVQPPPPDVREVRVAFDPASTEAVRSAGAEQVCCYRLHVEEFRQHIIPGRPLRHDGETLLPSVNHEHAWCAPLCDPPPLSALTEEDRAWLGSRWLEDARMEHASVASFARAALELMVHAAPLALIEDYQRAALDEVEHAQRCFSVASAYLGAPRSAGSLPHAPPARRQGLDALAREVFSEACEGETTASLMATRAASACQLNVIRETLLKIAEDEARHAALAWRTLAWAIQAGGEAVKTALREVAAREEQALDLLPPAPTLSRSRSERYRDHGRLDAPLLMQIRREAWYDVTAPLLDQLLAS